ncbi:unnamed protein product [Rotaria sordida]|uniref:Uncharacterized protein n=2 Tax=Rotaria sordida TaxID=392033 RepID=A0A818U9P5_9BILA|nr:unnamed protein product [Rotaria sordida]
METTVIPDKFKLTEEQLIQIGIEENISILDVQHIGASQGNLHLNENQIRSLMTHINLVNWMSLTSTLPIEQQQSWLILQLDQLIELCDQQMIDIDKLLDNIPTLQNSSLFDSSNIKFTLTSSQIAHLINQNNFDIRKLIDIEQNLKQQDIQAQQFRLNSSQLAYLCAHHRAINNQGIIGLSVAQLIGIYMLQQKLNENDPSLLFSLDYQQIKHLALIQNMSLEHFHSLPSSNKPFQLTHNQLIHLAMENKIPIKQLITIHNDQKSKIFDQKQLCALINQNSQPNMIQKSADLTQSIDKSFHIQQHVHLTVEQIFSLIKSSNIKLNQLTTCTTEHIDMIEFRFKPEQLVTLWDMNISIDDLEYTTSSPRSLSQFILSDEQFSSLLYSVSTSILSTHYKSSIMMKPLIQSNKSINIIEKSTDMQNQLHSSLADQLTAMHERLKSSIQTHIETVEIVSNSILKRNRIENTLNLVHQLSLHSIDDISTKEVETIPSFILDLLKINTITENIYKSIKQGEITSDILDKPVKLATKSKEMIDLIANGNLNKTIIESIQTYELSFSQIYKIQTQLLTPKLIEEFKSENLSKRILDAYKSQSPLQIINKVRSSVTQLNKLLLQQSSSISQSDPTIVPIVQQTTTQNIITTDNVFESDDLNTEKQISSNENIVDKSYRATKQNPIIIYPKSPTIRQQILQELRDRLDGQLLELKKEYGIEPIKGKPSIRQITTKLRTMEIIKELETLIGRQIDEVDILNILEGHISALLDEVQVDTNQTNVLFNRNIQQRLNRINERIQLVNILQHDIENKRLKRQMNLEELTALVLEDIQKFEQLTNIHLTTDDLRIISMNRFSSLEQSITRQLTESEYRYLLENHLSFDYIEQKVLKRPLTVEERIEQEELTLQPYQELFTDKTSILSRKFIDNLKQQQNIKLTHTQLEQILQYRAQLVDQYDIIHSISPLIKIIEEQLNRSLTVDEKKRLIDDDYSMIEQIKNLKYNNINRKILPITASLLQLVENTQDKNLLENIKYLENDIGRSLTKQEIIMVANGDIIGLEKSFNKSLTTETIKSMYNNRFIDLKNELNRNLTDKEIRDILNGKLSGIEKVLGRQLTSTERLTYKPVNIIDLTASQLTHTPSIDTTVQELEDVLERRLTLDEIQYLTDQQNNVVKEDFNKKLSSNQLDIKEVSQIQLTDFEKDNSNEDLFIFDRILKQPIHFTLSEIEKAIGKSLNSDELKRFAGSRFIQIEYDLGKSLSDLQRSNLLNGDKLTIESLIDRQLSPEETGPHIVDITNIERILNRSLTLDELTNLAGDRFDEIRIIFQRPFKHEELIDLLNGNYTKIIKLIDEKLNIQKEDELQELPINRIRYFENILHRKLSPHELLRFAENRFEPLSRLLSDVMKSEQILDLASGHYDKIEIFFNRSLTSKEKYDLKKSILQANIKYSNSYDELEYIIQRRLNEQELRTLIGNQYHEIEIRLGKLLTEKQIRNILHGEYDYSLIEVEDLINYLKRKYQDNQKRTQNIFNQLIKKIDQDYIESPKESIIIKPLRQFNVTSSIQQQQSDLEFHQSTSELLEQLSNDVEKHKIIKRQDSLVDSHSSEIFDNKSISSYDELKYYQQQLLSDKEITPKSIFSSHELISSVVVVDDEIQPNKAFENITRIVESIADKEHIEEMTTVTNAIDKFQMKFSRNVDKPSYHQTTATWLSNLYKDTTFSYPPTIEPIDNKLINRELSSPQIHTDDDLYLGWTLFKSIDRPDLGLKEEKPRMINVKHIAQTYVVGIPEEYADTKTKAIANKIYQEKSILPRSPKSRIIKEMTEFVSQLFHMPIINDATHFIVPSRTYNDIIESTNIYESEIIHIEDDELQMRDSPETLEWYEECIQRNIQIHAQIPTEYQPSIVYCHTGRQSVITPAKRVEQRKISIEDAMVKSKVVLDQPESKVPKGISTFNSGFIERRNQSLLDFQSIESTSTSQTVTDLIIHTITTSQKTNLLEALEELFSQENLDTYQITESHWHDIFLILLNSYLRSQSINRQEIFQRLTDKLHDLRNKERRRSSEFYPNISIASSTIDEIINTSNESDIIGTKRKSFHFGLRSSFDSMNSIQSQNDLEYNSIPVIIDQQSIINQEKILSSTNNNSLIQSFSQNHSSIAKSKIVSHHLVPKKSSQFQSNIDKINVNSIEHINKHSSVIRQNLSINSNAINEHQCSSTPMKHRRYKITVMHSDEPLDIPSNHVKTSTEATKLPPIVPKKRLFSTKQSISTALFDNQLLPSSSTTTTTKQIRKKIFSNFRNK